MFSPAGASLELRTTKRFKFLFVGGTIYRKGIDILLESYSRAFTPKDDVCLVIKDLGVNTLYKGQTAQDLIRKYQERKGAPEILYLWEEFNEKQMAAFIGRAMCLSHPTGAKGSLCRPWRRCPAVFRSWSPGAGPQMIL